MTKKQLGKALIFAIILLGFLGLIIFSGLGKIFADDSATIPEPPSDLVVNADSSTDIDLSWFDNSNNEDGFKVYRSRGSSFNLIADLGPNTSSYRDSGLKPNTRYYYRVSAYNEAGESDYSNEEYATTFQDVPKPPSWLSAKAVFAHRIDLSWNDNSENEDGFHVYRSDGSTYSMIASVGRDSISYKDTAGLQANLIYYYQVTAYNEAGESDYSNEASATTFAR